MDTINTAEIGTKLEVGFDEIAVADHGLKLHDFGLDGFELVDVGSFTRETGETYPKAITVRDPDGNILVKLWMCLFRNIPVEMLRKRHIHIMQEKRMKREERAKNDRFEKEEKHGWC